MQHELFEELQACNPRWRTAYSTLHEAAKACRVLDLYHDFLATPEGKAYTHKMHGVPDYIAQAKAEREANDRLPYRLDNIGQVRDTGDE